MVKIFIGNIKEGSKAEELRALFEKHGKVTECDILTNFGFIHMEKEEDALKAVKALHETTFNSSVIRVEMSHGKKSEKGPYRGGFSARGATRGAYRGAFAPPHAADLYDGSYAYPEPEYGAELFDGYNDLYYPGGAPAGADLYAAADPYRAYAPDAYGRRRPVRADPYASSLADRRAAMAARGDPYAAAAVDPYYGPAAAPARPELYGARQPPADPYYPAAPRAADPYARAPPLRPQAELMDPSIPRAPPASAADPYAAARADPYAAAPGTRAAAPPGYDMPEQRVAQPAPPQTSRVLDRPPPEYYRRNAMSGGAGGGGAAAPAYEPLMERAAFPAPERTRPY